MTSAMWAIVAAMAMIFGFAWYRYGHRVESRPQSGPVD